MAQSHKLTRNNKPVKTYFLQFDGGQLFNHGYSPFIIEHVFDTGSKVEIFHKLFDNEDGWNLLQNMFELLFNSDECGILGCTFPETKVDDQDGKTWEDYLITHVVNHYTAKGVDQFFKDVDHTWTTNEITAYAFVRSDEMDKLMAIMYNCSMKGVAFEDKNTDRIPLSEWNVVPKKKLSKKK